MTRSDPDGNILTGPPADRLADLVQHLFAPGVAVAVTDPRRPQPPVQPAEDAMTAAMVAARKRSFAAGRTAARLAMKKLGARAAPVPAAPDRSPVWPDGLTGSISHTAACCIATVAGRAQFRSLGIDVEHARALDPELLTSVCTHSERAWLDSLPPDSAGRMAMLIFSAKECTFKCQYPISGALIGFDAVEITVQPASSKFSARFCAGVPGFPGGTCLEGRFVQAYGLIVTAIGLAAV